MHLVTGLHASKRGLQLKFTEPIDPKSLDADNIHIKTWTLKRTAEYGSEHYDEKTLNVHAVSLENDRRTLNIDVADIAPTWCMEIAYQVRAADGQSVAGVIHNTIHELAEE